MNIVYIEQLDIAVNLSNLDAMEEDKIKGVHYTSLYMSGREEPIKVEAKLTDVLAAIRGSQNQEEGESA